MINLAFRCHLLVHAFLNYFAKLIIQFQIWKQFAKLVCSKYLIFVSNEKVNWPVSPNSSLDFIDQKSVSDKFAIYGSDKYITTVLNYS